MKVRKTSGQRGPSLCLVSFLSLVVLLSASSAEAYLDPTSGSYVIQILLAMVVSIGVAVRHYWARLKALWNRLTSRTTPGEPTSRERSGGQD